MNGETHEVYSSGDRECLAYNMGSGQTSVTIVMRNHGDEQGPVHVVEEMFEEGNLDYDELDITVIPEANAYASSADRRETPLNVQGVEADEGDMNRNYEDARRALEGDKETSELNTTGQAAYQVLGYIKELDPDLVIDMHTGTSETKKMAQARYKFQKDYKASKERMKDVSHNAGVDVVVGTPSEGAQMMGAVLPKMGVPAVTLEAGGGERHGKEGSFERDEADSYRSMTANILDYVAVSSESDYEPTEYTDINKVHAPIETPAESKIKYHFDLGDEVLEGDTVATLTPIDDDGKAIENEEIEVESLYNGILETLRSDSSRDDVRNGNRIFNIAST